MEESIQLPEQLQNIVSEIGGPVTSEQISNIGKLTEISDKSFKLRTVVNAWQNQHSEERIMRRGFAIAILIALFIQIAAINTAFFLIGFKIISVERWVSTTFIISVFVEIVSMTMLVLRYLFPKMGTELMQLVKNI
jgi:hypothetical protein